MTKHLPHHLFVCSFFCLERALARIPSLHRPVEWHIPSYKNICHVAFLLFVTVSFAFIITVLYPTSLLYSNQTQVVHRVILLKTKYVLSLLVTPFPPARFASLHGVEGL